jgi:hypothetical protein
MVCGEADLIDVRFDGESRFTLAVGGRRGLDRRRGGALLILTSPSTGDEATVIRS